MKNLMKKTRKGFTLVELLIAIIILGALASTMMLSAGNSVAAAKANTIISNMVTIKDAAVMYYSSLHLSATVSDFESKAGTYLGDFQLNKRQGSATFNVVARESDSTKWYVKAVIEQSDNDRDAIKDYLARSASKSQLISTIDGSGTQYKAADGNTLYMQIK